MKTDQTPGAPAAQQTAPAVQQNVPAEKLAPALKSDQRAAPMSEHAAKGSSGTDGSSDVTSERTARRGGARYAGRHYGRLHYSYGGHHRGYSGYRHYGYSWIPGLWF